jgi:hypothetical protein
MRNDDREGSRPRDPFCQEPNGPLERSNVRGTKELFSGREDARPSLRGGTQRQCQSFYANPFFLIESSVSFIRF